MRNSTGIWLIVIAAITILAAFFVFTNPDIGGRKIEVRPGLDIQGGLRVLLTADSDVPLDSGKMDQARQIVERRVNALGVAEPVVQVAGSNRILVELPGIKDPKAAIDTVKQTGLLEFVDFSPTGGCSAPMPGTGQYILTDKQVALRGGKLPTPATAQATVAGTPTSTFTPEPAVISATAAATEAAAQATPAATTAASDAAATP